MVSKIKHTLVAVVILIISLFLIHLLIPDYHPFGGINVTNDKDFISKVVYHLLDKNSISYDKEKMNFNIEYDRAQMRFLNEKYPLNIANQKLNESETSFYWSIKQISQDDSDIVVTNNSRSEALKSKSNMEIKCTDEGRVFSFSRVISDKKIKDTMITVEQAKYLTKEFIKNINEDIILMDDSLNRFENDQIMIFTFKGIEAFQKGNRRDYKLQYETKDREEFNLLLTASVKGEIVESFNIEGAMPEVYKNSSSDLFEIITEIAFVLIIIISVMIIGFKRFRAFEIGFKHAIVFGIVIFISFVSKEILERYSITELNFILGLLFGGIIIAGAGIILWAVSETVFREIWNDKLLTLDLIRHAKFNHSFIGQSLIAGISFGFGLTGIFLLSLDIITQYFNISFSSEFFLSISHLNATLPALNIVFGVINAYGILAVSFFIFLDALIKKYINNDYLFVLVSGLIWAVLVHSRINPLTAGIPVNFIIGLALSFILLKYDLLTTLLSYFIFQFLIKATQFSFIEEPNLHSNWLFVLLIFGAAFILGITLFFKKNNFTDYDSITPKFVENITERQRLQKELEVARHVQMSFLPKSNPLIDGLEISSICIPAFEVGGDYYDFIKLDDHKLGIIVGDVSGKGTQAAFYMTLTKGFIKAIAKQTDSPAEVLTKMNELFYENVERGRFISMVYALVDMNNKTIKVARAGHNPIIQNDNQENINLINPKGLALGLEKGDLFRRVITEHEEKLISGKNYIFYTDGFTEATNKKGVEYGLESLMNIAKNNSEKSAEQLLEIIKDDIKLFIGKAQQHDDMTMVILKIK